MQIDYLKYSIKIKLEKNTRFQSSPSFIIRSILGYNLKKIACILKRNSCDSCDLKITCAYSYIFETPLEKDNKILKGRNKLSHPYSICTSFEPNQETDTIKLDLNLFGRGVDYFPYIYHALKEAGKTGLGRERISYEITNILVNHQSILGKDGSLTNMDKSVWDYSVSMLDNKIFHSTHDKVTSESLTTSQSKEDLFSKPSLKFPFVEDSSGISYQGSSHFSKSNSSNINPIPKVLDINFISPFRLKVKGRYVKSISYYELLIAIKRRVEILSQSYGRFDKKIEFEELEQFAKEKKIVTKLRWIDQQRYSSRQKTSMKMGGLVGQMQVTGDFSPKELNLLKAGELFQMGKNTGFGLGKIKMK